MTRRLLTTLLLFLTSWGMTALAGEELPRLSVLLVNDDGYNAAGLSALTEAMAEVAEVFVVAPRRQESGTGHAITTTREPLLVYDKTEQGGPPRYAVDARPATCTRLGLESLVPKAPDLVISGINSGANLGLVSFYSGTVGAAREAVIAGYPAISVSLEGGRTEDYPASARIVRDLVLDLQAQDAIQPGLFLNVNLPAHVSKRFKGLRLTRQSLEAPQLSYERRVSPGGQVYYWGQYTELSGENDEPDSDVRAVRAGFGAVTPLTIDQSAMRGMERLSLSESLLNSD